MIAEHYKSIAKDLESGFFRQPVQPMSDNELARAIAEFRKAIPSVATRGTLGDAFNPREKVRPPLGQNEAVANRSIRG
jgi:hypothetical protein